jgi:hypothetical protein
MPIASGVLDVDYTDEHYDDRAGTHMSRRRLRKVFRGDIEGESAGEFLMAVAPGGSAAYVGIDGVTAATGGASGSFVLVHSATRTPDSAIGADHGLAGLGHRRAGGPARESDHLAGAGRYPHVHIRLRAG